MLTRRLLLQSSFATAFGLFASKLLEPDLSESGRFLVGSDSLDHPDRPRTLIYPDFYPIHPDRVVVMRGDGWLPRNTEEDRLWRRLDCGLQFTGGKIDMIFRLMHVLTDYYHKPQLFEAWATGVANRESLGSTGVGGGFGLLHQFQDDGHVRLVTPPVDWWLFLFPIRAIPGVFFDQQIADGVTELDEIEQYASDVAKRLHKQVWLALSRRLFAHWRKQATIL